MREPFLVRSQLVQQEQVEELLILLRLPMVSGVLHSAKTLPVVVQPHSSCHYKLRAHSSLIMLVHKEALHLVFQFLHMLFEEHTSDNLICSVL